MTKKKDKIIRFHTPKSGVMPFEIPPLSDELMEAVKKYARELRDTIDKDKDKGEKS